MESHLTNAGAVVLKFWLHIDKDEQEKRFKERQEDPLKQWKITEEDWRTEKNGISMNRQLMRCWFAPPQPMHHGW